MRLWSLHPKYLDRQGLVACWREALLAQHVLAGFTKGYKNHPQLDRFRQTEAPLLAISTYLHGVVDEAVERRYNFDRTKILYPVDPSLKLQVTSGQLSHEWQHLLHKLKVRNVVEYNRCKDISTYEPHPLFVTVPGNVAPWERI